MKKIIGLLLPLILIVIGIQFTRDYFGDNGAETKAKYEKLISEGQTATANLASQYKETTIKIAGLPIKLYEVEYSFSANGQEYSGTKSLKGPPSELQMEVTYLSSDPSVNAINPNEELNSIGEYESSSSTLYIGLGLLLVGLIIAYFRIKSFRKPKIDLSNRKEKKVNRKTEEKTEFRNEKKSKFKLEKTDLVNEKSADSKEIIEDLKKSNEIKKDFEPSDHSKYMPKNN